MTNFLTRRNREAPAAAPAPAETREEAFANAVAAFRQATGKAETRVISCRCAVHGQPFALYFERLNPAQQFRIASTEASKASAGEHPARAVGSGALPAQQSYAAGEFDWSGCACPHCGNGSGLVICATCGETVCGGRKHSHPDGTTTFACHDGCGAAGTIGPATHIHGDAGPSRPPLSNTLQLPGPSATRKSLTHRSPPRLPGR